MRIKHAASEAAKGDPHAYQERLAKLQSILVIETTERANDLAKELLQRGTLPVKATDDALNIAVAAIHAVPYLLTWNCRHLANALMKPMIDAVCDARGFKAPIKFARRSNSWSPSQE